MWEDVYYEVGTCVHIRSPLDQLTDTVYTHKRMTGKDVNAAHVSEASQWQEATQVQTADNGRQMHHAQGTGGLPAGSGGHDIV